MSNAKKCHGRTQKCATESFTQELFLTGPQIHRKLPPDALRLVKKMTMMMKEGRTTSSKASHRKKNTKCQCLKLLERSKLTRSEHGSLHGSAGPSQHGYQGIKDGMASAMGTSGWTHVDARWVPRSKKSHQKTSYWELTSPCSSLNHSTSNAKECVQATQVGLGKEIQVRARWSTRQEAAFAHRHYRRRGRHGQAAFRTLL